MKTKIKTKTLLLLLFIAALATLAPAQQRVSGIIDRETRWKAEDGPYIIEGDILVARWATLTIFPGTRIIIAESAVKQNLAEPFDRLDSTLVSIRIQGSFNCVGRRNMPIIFEPEITEPSGFKWHGMILDGVDEKNVEIAFVEISGAAVGITVSNTNVLVRNSAFENNNIGVRIVNGRSPRIFNNLITSNFTAGIKVDGANPRIRNNIIAFNRNAGLWCDNISRITFAYNNVFGNGVEDFYDCEPGLGVLTRAVRNRDSTDNHGNIVTDPIFVGSPAEARAIELDVNLQSDTTRVRDRRLIHLPNLQFGTRPFVDPTNIGAYGRELSRYSPCHNAGDPAGHFRNADGTRNTMGPSGGPDFMAR